MPRTLGLQVLVGHEPQRPRVMTVVTISSALLGDRALRRVNCTSACSSLRSSRHDSITLPSGLHYSR
jgi:hypothetical protein